MKKRFGVLNKTVCFITLLFSTNFTRTNLFENHEPDMAITVLNEPSFTINFGTLDNTKYTLSLFSPKGAPDKQIITYIPIQGPNKGKNQKILLFFASVQDQESFSEFSYDSREMIKKQQKTHPDAQYVLCALRIVQGPPNIRTLVAVDYFKLFFCTFFREFPKNIAVIFSTEGDLTDARPLPMPMSSLSNF